MKNNKDAMLYIAMSSGRFFIEHADDSFLEKCAGSLKHSRTPVSDFLGADFDIYLMSMYGRLKNDGKQTLYGHFRLKSPYVVCRYLDLAIAMYNISNPTVCCFRVGDVENHYDRIIGSDYVFCRIDETKPEGDKCRDERHGCHITFATPEFSNLIKSHILHPEALLSLDIISETFSSSYPIRKIILLKNSDGKCRPFSVLTVPSGHRFGMRSMLLFLCMLPKPLENADFESLTARELDILPLIASGLTNRSIAMELSISEGTVKKIVCNIFSKLGINSRMDLYGIF